MKRITQALLLVFVTCIMSSCKEEIFVYYLPGPLQVLGNEKELYFFIDINRIAQKGYSVSDAPTTYPIGHIQDILVIDANGLVKKTHVNIDKAKGVTFHPNSVQIFRYDNQFYAYSIEAQTSYSSIFKWNEKEQRFTILPLEESNAFLKKFGNSESSNCQVMWNVFLNLSKKNGSDFYFSQTAMDEDNFKWNGLNISVKVKTNKDDFNIIIDCAEKRKGFPIVLTYPIKPINIDKKTFKEMSNYEYGHPKPWYKQ